MSSSILVVHNDAHVRAATRIPLEREGFRVDETNRLVPAEAGSADLLIVAWTSIQSVAEGLALVQRHPGSKPTRVITLARREDMRNAIRTLELGADDCLSVPFEPEELVMRVKNCLRRPVVGASPERLSAGPVLLDKAVHRVLVEGQLVDLAPTEFRLMTFFLENQGRVYSRAELLSRAWAKNIKAGHRTVDVHVRRLRQQLEPFGCDTMIQTVRGFGYRFSADGTRESDAELHRFAMPLARS
jgi:two-component system phosphate regulon response regulator PhoB